MIRLLQILPVALAGLLWLSRFFLRDGGVGVVNGLVVFLITWWLVVFMTLPIGVRSQEEQGEVTEGSERGAPVAPMLAQKAWWTTIATSVIWIIYFGIAESGLIEQFLPRDGYWG